VGHCRGGFAQARRRPLNPAIAADRRLRSVLAVLRFLDQRA
jgi:hypothetical protein